LEGTIAYGVQEGVALDLGGAAAGVVDVVALQGDEIAVTIEVDGPVVVSVTGGRVGGDTVDEVVGDGHALGGLGTQDDVLTTDASSLWLLEGDFLGSLGRKRDTYGNVINPDHVGVVNGDGITTPDVLGVDISDSNVPLMLLEGIICEMLGEDC
jgi:hypothetical protein